MSQLFQAATSKLAGAMKSDDVFLNFGGADTALTQTINISFSQNITRLYEIGSLNRMYYIGGRAQGQLSLGRVIGPAIVVAEFYEKFGDVCSTASNTIAMTISRCAQIGVGAQDVRFYAKYCSLLQVGISASAQELIVNEQCGLMFSALEYD